MCDVSAPEIEEAYREVRKDGSETDWLLLGYEGNSKIVLQDKGAGGLDDLASRFADDQAQYAYIRVISGDQESRRTKFIFISWCGESVGALKRAKMSVHKASVKQVIKDFAVEIHATTKSELESDEVMNKVKKAGGADYSGSLSN